MTSKRRPGFTLVEVLIVVVIMAVLAATIIPQFADSTMMQKQAPRNSTYTHFAHKSSFIAHNTTADFPQLICRN